jgi:hypothetical protein
MAQNPANPKHVGPQEPTTYLEFYNGMPDTLNGVYTEFLDPFGPESAAQPATLWDLILTMANDILKVFAVVQETPHPAYRFRAWPPTRYAQSWMGAHNHGWDDTIFGFQGDLQSPRQPNQHNRVAHHLIHSDGSYNGPSLGPHGCRIGDCR